MTNGECPFAEQIRGVTTFNSGNTGRVGFCDHAAGGFYSTMQSAAFWNGQGVSTHFAIARDGRICQMVNIFDTAWAQGRLGPTVNWPSFGAMNRENPNNYLISTEHEDYELVNGKSHWVPGSQWTQAQFDADLKLKRWCMEEVRRVTGENLLTFGIDSLAGHYMFDGVNRAECPGKFWREEYRAKLHAGLGVPPAPFEPVEGDDMDPKVKALIAAAFILSIGNPITDLGPEDRAAIKAVVAALG